MNLATARRTLSETVNRVAYGGERVVIRRRGKPLAALIAVSEMEALAQAIGDIARALDAAPAGRRKSAPALERARAILQKQETGGPAAARPASAALTAEERARFHREADLAYTRMRRNKRLWAEELAERREWDATLSDGAAGSARPPEAAPRRRNRHA